MNAYKLNEKRLNIPVRFRVGTLELWFGGPLPNIKQGARADLVIRASDLEDPTEISWLEEEKNVLFFPRDTLLMARVSLSQMEVGTQYGMEQINVTPNPGERYRYVPFALQADLMLAIKPSTRGELRDCGCSLPTLDRDAVSVNHAYTLISEHYETKRRTHSGNVFECVYAEDDFFWKPLSYFREMQLVQFEQTLSDEHNLPNKR